MEDLRQPESAAELAAILASASAKKQAVALGGNFSKQRWGGPIQAADVRVSTSKLDKVLEYEPRDLTISVEAGMPYAALTALLAKNQQMIPLDPPYASQATIGGVLAANHSGPRRRLYGTGRDLVIGIEFATMEGKLVQAGGMVVKNVAGLDMGKLLIGSWGTLAVLTRVNFKLIPKDKATRTFVQVFPTAKDAFDERRRLLQSVLQPAAVDMLNPAAAKRIGRTEGWTLAVGVGGSPALMDRYSRELPAAEVLAGDEERKLWGDVETFAERFLAEYSAGAIVRASCPLQELAAVVEPHEGPLVARAANGIAYLGYPVAPSKLPKPSANWPAPGVHMVMEAGPPDRSPEALWPEPGNEFSVMQKIKNMLDPQHLLNKGRLHGRI